MSLSPDTDCPKPAKTAKAANAAGGDKSAWAAVARALSAWAAVAQAYSAWAAVARATQNGTLLLRPSCLELGKNQNQNNKSN